jgi:EAL domain-containing protein (putative c-di-GMP-specific phosphodiesterase class I)
VLTSEPAHAVATAEALAEIGVGLSLDDFGTGYSSLVRLKRMPVSEVKVDSSFVGRLLESPDDEVVVKSILDLAAALGIRSVAEGVESAAVADALLAMGCVAAQGWHFAKPMNAMSATTWLTEHNLAGRDLAAPRGPAKHDGPAEHHGLAEHHSLEHHGLAEHSLTEPQPG